MCAYVLCVRVLCVRCGFKGGEKSERWRGNYESKKPLSLSKSPLTLAAAAFSCGDISVCDHVHKIHKLWVCVCAYVCVCVCACVCVCVRIRVTSTIVSSPRPPSRHHHVHHLAITTSTIAPSPRPPSRHHHVHHLAITTSTTAPSPHSPSRHSHTWRNMFHRYIGPRIVSEPPSTRRHSGPSCRSARTPARMRDSHCGST